MENFMKYQIHYNLQLTFAGIRELELMVIISNEWKKKQQFFFVYRNLILILHWFVIFKVVFVEIDIF